MKNIFRKGMLFSAMLLSSTLAFSQVKTAGLQLKDVKDVSLRKNTSMPLKQIPAAAYKNATSVQARVSSVAKASAKPGTYYTVNNGVYHLVPDFLLGQDNNGANLYANCGVLGYIDRNMVFKNKTPLCDEFTWTLFGQEVKEDSIVIHPFFASDGLSIETPVLQSTLSGVDSVYQMGTCKDANGALRKGMVALNGGAFVYNVDVDAQPFMNTFYGTTSADDPWNNILFGNDTEYKPLYMEFFEEPAGGPVFLNATHFYVASPLTEDLKGKTFTVAWWEMNLEKGEWEVRKELSVKADSYVEYQSLNIRLWDLMALDEELDVMVKNSFAVVVNGPQDGSKWAMIHQLDRMDFPDKERNTAFFIPTEGTNKGQLCQYQIGYVDNGQVVTEFYNTSLDIHQYILTPFILLCKDDANMTIYDVNELDLDINGEERKFVLSDWYGGPSANVKITATVEQGDENWLTVTQPEASLDGYTFNFTVKAESKDFLVEGRKAVVTLTDSKGFSRDIIFYQGDRNAADNPMSVEGIESDQTLSVVSEGNSYQVTCPAGSKSLKVFTVSGLQVAEYPVSAEGTVEVSKASLAKGIYLFQVSGKSTQTIKVLH